MLGERYVSSANLRVLKGLSVETCHARYAAMVQAAKVRLENELQVAAKPQVITCKACGSEFSHEGVGRPRSFCPKCYSGPGKKEYEKAYQRGYYARRKEGLSGYEKGMD